jgi:hypothetical protein
LGRLLDGRLITFTLAAHAKKQGYCDSAAFSWQVFSVLRLGPLVGRLWGYFSRGKSQNG